MKILLVEDNEISRKLIRAQLEMLFEKDSINILEAEDQQDAHVLFWNHLDIDVILMDGCVPKDAYALPPGNLNTMDMVKEMRDKFGDGPIIAISSDPEYNRKLLAAGCSDMSEKDKVARMVHELATATT